jgi:hypothetical protein
VNSCAEAGFGQSEALVRVYIAIVPPLAEYTGLHQVTPLQTGEIELINSACGNGWRKVFNVYSKLLFALDAKQFSFARHADSWQQYRDQFLLQAGSNTALLFSMPELTAGTKGIHIIAGRSHARGLLDNGLTAQLNWLNKEFAIDKFNRLLVCPYFDYRQLNNEKLAYLANLIKAIDE